MKRLTFLFLCIILSVSSFAQTIKLGSPAPNFDGIRYVKGSPIDLKDGKIHVVEFWATWCGPCVQSIPHLTRLAREYATSVDILGISIWESGDEFQDNVIHFVEEMGDQMDYKVAVDDFPGDDGTASKNWMKAAGAQGVPTAFIIDREGIIVWIGHPETMDEVLGAVVAGTYDVQAEIQRLADAELLEEMKFSVARKAIKAMGTGDYTSAVQVIDGAIAKMPGLERGLFLLKLQALGLYDKSGAVTYAKIIPVSFLVDDSMSTCDVAYCLMNLGAYEVVSDILERVISKSKSDQTLVLDVLARAYYKRGEVQKAIETQKRAITALDKATPLYHQRVVNELRSHLQEYQERKE